MPITKSMNDMAKLACSFLDDESLNLIQNYIKSRMNEDGGFKGRDSRSDLYYTLFGLECSETLNIDVDWQKLWQFLKPFCERKNLDFVHTICLIRCINRTPGLPNKQNLIERLFQYSESFRSDNGYRLNLDDKYPSIYALFLAILAHEECQKDFGFASDAIMKILNNAKTNDGAYADQTGLKKGTTTVTAAAILVMYKLGFSPDKDLIKWIKKQYSIHGGFKASPLAPIPDLLSTGTVLFALDYIGVNIKDMKDQTFDFVESVWNETGGFCGHLFEEYPDTEYTFYGLLSLGVLSKM